MSGKLGGQDGAVMLMLQGLHMRNDSDQDVTVHSADKCSNAQS